MVVGTGFQRTLSDADLTGLPGIEASELPWGPHVPAALADALSALSLGDALKAEETLAPLIVDHVDGPEVWWGLAIAMVGQQDLKNASTCYENFWDRVEIEVALALHDCERAPEAALLRVRRLCASLVRCRDPLLAARGLIMASGLELIFEEVAEASLLLREARKRIWHLWPRPAGLVAEWLATVAIARAETTDYRKPERLLRLALRYARREPENLARIAAIGRDLGLLLIRGDRNADAEDALASALAAARGAGNAALQTSIAVVQAQNLRAQRRYVESIALLDRALASDLPDQTRVQALLASADVMVRLGAHHRDRDQLAAAECAAAEAAALLQRAGLDATAALRERAVAAVMQGETASAREIAFELLAGGGGHAMPPDERVALAYLPYLIRMSEGQARRALFWAEYRLRTTLRARIDRPRDLLLLHEHCVAAAERLGDIVTVRRHALSILDAEPNMLRVALGEGRGPADWNRFRVAREGLSVLAAMEARTGEPGAAWRQAEALLTGRGLARSTRRSLRRGHPITCRSSVREFARQLSPDETLLGLVSMYPPAPVDPEFPWANGFSAPRLIAILVTGSAAEPEISDLGDFQDCASAVQRWTRDLAIGRAASTPPFLGALEPYLRDARTVLVLAEGEMELVPLRLLAPRSYIRQIPGLWKGRAISASGAPAVLIASDMLEDSFASATEQEAALVCAVVAGAARHVIGSAGGSTAVEVLEQVPRLIHIIAHGTAVLDARETDLDVYRGAAVELGSEMLSASTVADLHLDGVELVILSCCDTSKGAAQHAEGLASMAAAFLDAGAAKVIATLWPVPHEETAVFMGLLYAEDLRDPAIAVARAQSCARAAGLAQSCWAAWVTHESRFDAPVGHWPI